MLSGSPVQSVTSWGVARWISTLERTAETLTACVVRPKRAVSVPTPSASAWYRSGACSSRGNSASSVALTGASVPSVHAAETAQAPSSQIPLQWSWRSGLCR